MALDVQPLSRGRRLVMLAVMLGLLAASLGFAEYLVVRARRMPRADPTAGTVHVPPGDAE